MGRRSGYTCKLINRSPSSMLDDKNPHEVWTDKKPYLTHLMFMTVMHMFMFQRKT
jgi:hypothetical protein